MGMMRMREDLRKVGFSDSRQICLSHAGTREPNLSNECGMERPSLKTAELVWFACELREVVVC